MPTKADVVHDGETSGTAFWLKDNKTLGATNMSEWFRDGFCIVIIEMER